MKPKKIVIFLCIFLIAAGGVFSQEDTELRMPDVGISMQSLLHLFNFEVGEAEELAYIYAGDDDWWQGRQPLPDGYRFQFYIVNFAEGTYGSFATDETSDTRTSIHFFHGRDTHIDDFYSETVPEMVMFDPDDPYVFISDDFQLIENYYTELSNQFEILVGARAEAQANYDRLMAEYEAAKEDVEVTEEELEAKQQEMLAAMAELDSKEYRVVELQQKVADLRAQVDALEGSDEYLRDVIRGQQEEIDDLYDLRDPYKVRLRNLDRSGFTPYLKTTMGVDDRDLNSSDFKVFTEAEVGAYLSDRDDGLVYVLLNVKGDIDSDAEGSVRPELVLSGPREIFQVGTRGYFGDSGRGSYIYGYNEFADDGFNKTINPFVALKALGRENRAGVELGIESSPDDDADAFYANFSYYLTPMDFPYITFAVDRLSFAALQGEEIEGSMFRGEAGVDINWTADYDDDPEWTGHHHTWFIRFAYQVITSEAHDRVEDEFGLVTGFTFSLY